MYNDFKTKKYLGQHLLIDDSVIENIVSSADNLSNLTVLEIGPGTGNLTKQLLRSAKHVIAIEKDQATKKYLDAIHKEHKDKFTYIIKDALYINPLELTPKIDVIIANLPYNVGTALYTNWLKISSNLKYMVLMFQKEVAERITAKVNTSNYGRLTLFTKLYGEAEYLFTVNKEAFLPPPSVDSAVIKFIPHKFPLKINLEKFERLTKIAFNSKRKMLRQSLKEFNFNFKELNINESLRAQNLTFPEFCLLSETIK